MKKLILFLVLLIFCSSLFATVRSVCNMPYAPSGPSHSFPNFTSAHAASSANDTIYICGSSINYGSITISKNGLVIIGTGHNPNKTVPLTSMFTQINLSNASNCQLIGLVCEGISSSGITNGTIIRRCKTTGFAGPPPGAGIYIQPGFSAVGWLIEGNVFANASAWGINFTGGSTTNTIISNNIFNTSGAASIWHSSPATTPFTFSITNNIFLGSSTASFFSINYAMVNNNIFYRSSPQGLTSNSSMFNNISYMCAPNIFPAGIPSGNNLAGVDPKFVNFPVAGALFDYSYDFHLQPGSPCIASGTDGTDRGIYGGFGFKFNMTGEPAIAEITNFAITSPTIIPPGGTLNISVTSKRIR